MMVSFPPITIFGDVQQNSYDQNIVTSNGILWIKEIDDTVKLCKLMKKSHSAIISYNNIYNHHLKSELVRLITTLPSNIKNLVLAINCTQLSNSIIFPRHLTHIEFIFETAVPPSIPKITHTVSFDCPLYCKLKLSKNIVKLKIHTCQSEPLDYPKNVMVLQHVQEGPQYPKMSKKLKYLHMMSVKHISFDISKNVSNLIIRRVSTCFIILPKNIKMFKLPTILRHNIILPKYMNCISVNFMLPFNIIIPEELNKLELWDFVNRHNNVRHMFIRDNIPNGVKCVIKNMSVEKMPNRPNTMID